MRFFDMICLAVFVAFLGSFAGIGVRYVIDSKTDAGKIARKVYKAIDDEEENKVIKLNGYIITIERKNK